MLYDMVIEQANTTKTIDFYKFAVFDKYILKFVMVTFNNPDYEK
jgi:hypothetical protein